jgi:GNAT superfamily N-acetyltransferase
MSKPINRIITGQHPVVSMRRAKMVDVPALETLIEQSWRESGEGKYTPRQIESAVQSIGKVDSHLIEDGTLQVVTSGGEIVAVGGWSARGARYRGDLEAATGEKVDPATTPANLRCFYVNPFWTRMGLATQLLHEVIASAKLRGFQKLAVLATQMSQPFFAAQGFEAQEPTEISLPDGVKLSVTPMSKSIAE